MNSLLKFSVLTAALGAATLGGPSQAAPLPPPGPPTFLGTFTGYSGSNSTTFGNEVSGSFDDLYSFETTSRSWVGVSVTNKYQTAADFISDFAISFYSGPPSSTTLITTAIDGKAVSPDGRGFQVVDLDTLGDAGTYYFTISGTTADTPSYGGSLNLTVSAVPLPASAPLFGAAVLALGIGGYRMRRQGAPVA